MKLSFPQIRLLITGGDMVWHKLFIVVMMFSLLIIGACANSTVEKVEVYEMASFSEAKSGTSRTFTEFKSVDAFVKAFARANKEPGIVDMIDPGYQVEFDGKSYFLWINEDHGTIMDTIDTHTIYTLSKKSVEKIYELLNS